MTIFNCRVEINGEEHHNKDYKSLKEISNELKLYIGRQQTIIKNAENMRYIKEI